MVSSKISAALSFYGVMFWLAFFTPLVFLFCILRARLPIFVMMEDFLVG